MESNLAQINAIRCRSIIMQMNTSAQRLFMSLQRIFILVISKVKLSNLKLVLVYIPLNPLYCINSLGPNFGVFESLHKEKHINSTRKRVQSATHRIFHRKAAQFFETELNMSLEHSILAVRNCARAYKCMN